MSDPEVGGPKVAPAAAAALGSTSGGPNAATNGSAAPPTARKEEKRKERKKKAGKEVEAEPSDSDLEIVEESYRPSSDPLPPAKKARGSSTILGVTCLSRSKESLKQFDLSTTFNEGRQDEEGDWPEGVGPRRVFDFSLDEEFREACEKRAVDDELTRRLAILAEIDRVYGPTDMARINAFRSASNDPRDRAMQLAARKRAQAQARRNRNLPAASTPPPPPPPPPQLPPPTAPPGLGRRTAATAAQAKIAAGREIDLVAPARNPNREEGQDDEPYRYKPVKSTVAAVRQTLARETKRFETDNKLLKRRQAASLADQEPKLLSAIPLPGKRKRTILEPKPRAFNLNVTLENCTSLYPIITCAIGQPLPSDPPPMEIRPIATLHYNSDDRSTVAKGECRSHFRYHLDRIWFEHNARVTVMLERGPEFERKAGKGRLWPIEGTLRLMGDIDGVNCVVEDGNLGWELKRRDP